MTKRKQKADWRVVCMGMVCITSIELYALSQGINGVVLTGVIAMLAAAIGVSLPQPKFIQK